jgi:putative membrane protein
MESKQSSYRFSGQSFNRALALFVALGLVTSAVSLFANDNEDKDKTRDNPTSAQTRDVNPGAHEQEDLNAKTDPEKFIRGVSYYWGNEIRLGNLAKQRAQNQEVKQFADKIVQDHTKVNNELKRIAQKKNITLETDVTAATTTPASPSPARDRVGAAGTTPTPATPSTPRDAVGNEGTPRGAGARDIVAGARKAHAQQVYDQMSSLSGKAFDDAFTTHMVQSHTKSVAKFEKASSDLEDGELKQFVESTLPALREHLAMAQRLAPPDANRLNVRERTGKDTDYKKDQDKPKQDQDKPNK